MRSACASRISRASEVRPARASAVASRRAGTSCSGCAATTPGSALITASTSPRSSRAAASASITRRCRSSSASRAGAAYGASMPRSGMPVNPASARSSSSWSPVARACSAAEVKDAASTSTSAARAYPPRPPTITSARPAARRRDTLERTVTAAAAGGSGHRSGMSWSTGTGSPPESASLPTSAGGMPPRRSIGTPSMVTATRPRSRTEMRGTGPFSWIGEDSSRSRAGARRAGSAGAPVAGHGAARSPSRIVIGPGAPRTA
jgi:hypothetical protein